MNDLKDRIQAYLTGRPSGASSGEITAEVMKLRGGSPAIFERIVRTALDGDIRFIKAPDGRWQTVQKPSPNQMIFSVISLRADSDRNRLIEIGAVRLSEGREIFPIRNRFSGGGWIWGAGGCCVPPPGVGGIGGVYGQFHVGR